MCQFNEYLISRDVSPDKVIKIMKAAGMGDFCTGNADEFGYNIYAMSGAGCNCGSIISLLQDKPYKSFDEYHTSEIKEETTKLEKIKDFMLNSNYAKNKAVYVEKQAALYVRKKELFRPLDEFEITPRPDEIGQKLTDERKHELQYSRQKYDELYEKIIQSKEARLCLDEIKQFNEDNQMMATSCSYSLNDNGKSLLGNIFTAIEKAKEMYKYVIDEFNAIKTFIIEILKYSSQMKLFAYWASDFEKLSGETIINIKDFGIDDLAFLPYGKLLSIRT